MTAPQSTASPPERCEKGHSYQRHVAALKGLALYLDDAGEGSRELDVRIHHVLGLDGGRRVNGFILGDALRRFPDRAEDIGLDFAVPAYTTSDQAARELLERTLPSWFWGLGKNNSISLRHEYSADAWGPDGDYRQIGETFGATPALALSRLVVEAHIVGYAHASGAKAEEKADG